MYTAKIITVSDRCAAHLRADESGPALLALLQEAGYAPGEVLVVPDEREMIETALIAAVQADYALILTTGGTGFSPRDVTPEATIAVAERMVPGIPEAMRAYALRLTPRAMLSRAVCVIRGRSLMLNLPGSPRAARENLEAVLPAIEHGLAMLRGGTADCAADGIA